MVRKNRTWLYVGAAVLLLACVVVSSLAGLFVGGVAGYALGERSAARRLEVGRPEQGTPAWPPLELPSIPGWDLWPRGEQPLRWTAAARIVEVIADSPAERAGLQVGDLVVAIDGKPLSLDRSLGTAVGAYRPGDRIELTLERSGREQKAKVTLGEASDDPGRAYLGVGFRMVLPGQVEPSNGPRQ